MVTAIAWRPVRFIMAGPKCAWREADMAGRAGLVLFEESGAQARSLLAEAGYPEGRGLPVLRLSLPLWMEGDTYAVASTECWFRELGIRTYVVYEAPAARNERINA